MGFGWNIINKMFNIISVTSLWLWKWIIIFFFFKRNTIMIKNIISSVCFTVVFLGLYLQKHGSLLGIIFKTHIYQKWTGKNYKILKRRSQWWSIKGMISKTFNFQVRICGQDCEDYWPVAVIRNQPLHQLFHCVVDFVDS